MSVRKGEVEICSNLVQRDFYIIGDALPGDMFNGYLQGQDLEAQKEIMARAIAKSEGFGSATQFEPNAPPNTLSTASHKRYPLKDAAGGYGVYQLTNPVPTRDQIWNWKANVDAGLTLLDQKINQAQQRLNQHPPYTDEQLRLETYAQWNGGFFHVWQNNQWIEDPNYTCGCDNNPRKGQEVNPPIGDCRPLAQCYAEVTHGLE